ncbi:hypothetical protein [Meiothermus rufus]|uniref:hypothetical protein n=1 Tax=Meiothermus rufus TaxID=604332 RepID=UPI000411A9B5|nr:hypothetical protein [Meiothermus rufus]
MGGLRHRPQPYRYRAGVAGLEVFADEELGCWRFWSRVSELEGAFREGILYLEANPGPLLQAVLQIAFERLEARQVCWGQGRVSREDYFPGPRVPGA